MALTSSMVSRLTLPAPPKTPPIEERLGISIRRLEPRLERRASMAFCAPLPIASIAITAATPIRMPSMERRAAHLVGGDGPQGRGGVFAELGEADGGVFQSRHPGRLSAGAQWRLTPLDPPLTTAGMTVLSFVSSATILPSLIWMIRLAWAAMSGSCVTMMTVMPVRLRSLSWRRMSSAWSEARFPVGSSAKRIFGRLTSERAMATRCCWPPESWLGLWSMRSARPTSVEDFRGALFAVGRAGIDHRQRDIVQGARAGEQIEHLENEADGLGAQGRALIVGEPGDVLAHQMVGPVGGPVEQPQDLHERGFAGAGGADDGDEFAGFDGDRNSLRTLSSPPPTQ